MGRRWPLRGAKVLGPASCQHRRKWAGSLLHFSKLDIGLLPGLSHGTGRGRWQSASPCLGIPAAGCSNIPPTQTGCCWEERQSLARTVCSHLGPERKGPKAVLRSLQLPDCDSLIGESQGFRTDDLAQLPANATGKVMEADGTRTWTPATHVEDPGGVPVSWLQPGPDLATTTISGVNQHMENRFQYLLCHFAFQINSINLSKITCVNRNTDVIRSISLSAQCTVNVRNHSDQ